MTQSQQKTLEIAQGYTQLKKSKLYIAGYIAKALENEGEPKRKRRSKTAQSG